MKRIFTLFAACMVISFYQNVHAQCSINTSDTVPGFSPLSIPCIIPGVPYGQVVQFYIPDSISAGAFGKVRIDSVTLDSMYGLPEGISYSINPASGAIRGGSVACIWYSGTSTAPLGVYPLTFYGSAYTGEGHFSGTLNQLGENYSLCVDDVGCDTLFNCLATDQFVIYGVIGGYFSGNNANGALDVAEGFTSVIGAQISAAEIDFGICKINQADSADTVMIAIWNDSMIISDGYTLYAPNQIIDSAFITLSDIANAVGSREILFIPFPTPATLTDSLFYVGVVLPQTTGDTIAVSTDEVSAGNGNGWIYQVNHLGWFPYSLLNGVGPQGNYIKAIECGDLPIAAFTASPLSGCAGFSTSFVDQSVFANSWNWSITGATPDTSSTEDPLVQFSTAGSYAVSLTVTNLFGQNTLSQSNFITVNPNVTLRIQTTPASSNSSTDGTADVIVLTGTSPYFYTWSDDSATAMISGLAPGTYTVTVTDANSCSAVDTTTILSLGIRGVTGNNDIKIYPNPAHDIINVEWSIPSNALVDILDVSGNVVKAFSVDGSLLNTLDIHDLVAGTYIIRLTDKQSNQQSSTLFTRF